MDIREQEQLREIIRDIVREELDLGFVPMGDRWIGGKLILEPRDKQLQPKAMPIDGFFHKICMVRDRLRVLEQKINSHPKLSDADKLEMQQYVTRCYGSLTSFNVLFKEREDWFVGEKKQG